MPNGDDQQDLAKPILDPLPVDAGVKRAAWDAFHSSSTPEDFRAHFDTSPIPPEAKRALWDAKFSGGTGTPKQGTTTSTAVPDNRPQLKAPPKPFTGDWAKSMFYRAAEPATNALPAIGATVGGLLGSPVGGVPGATAGAAIGGAGGEGLRQLSRRALGFHDVPQTSAEAAESIGKEGLLQGGIEAATGGVGRAIKAGAPRMAESALGVTEGMRGRGRTIGESVLENTRGVRPATIAKESKAALTALTGEMENAVHQATQAGVTGSTQGAHAALDAAIQATPRNARDLIAKLEGLRDHLDLQVTPPGGVRRLIHTPDELLEIKRGLDKTMATWPPEWQKLADVQKVKQQLYGALDQELDRLIPGNAERNQAISSLIPAKQRAVRQSNQADISQRLMHRMAAHTGALAGAGIGAGVGYRSNPENPGAGAAMGAATGFVLPELLASPTAQMIAARTAANAPTIGKAIVAPAARLATMPRSPKKREDENE